HEEPRCGLGREFFNEKGISQTPRDRGRLSQLDSRQNIETNTHRNLGTAAGTFAIRKTPQSRVPRREAVYPGFGLTVWLNKNSIRHLILQIDRKSTRLNSSHSQISYAVFCLKKKKKIQINNIKNKTYNQHI